MKWAITLSVLTLIAGNGYYQNKQTRLAKLNNPDTYIDTITNYEWQNQVYVENERDAYFHGQAYQKVDTWENAKVYCESLTLNNMDDWELPDIVEIDSLFQHKKELKDYALFPYWSSTTNGQDETLAHCVNFSRYDILTRKKEQTAYIRCFRRR